MAIELTPAIMAGLGFGGVAAVLSHEAWHWIRRMHDPAYAKLQKEYQKQINSMAKAHQKALGELNEDSVSMHKAMRKLSDELAKTIKELSATATENATVKKKLSASESASQRTLGELRELSIALNKAKADLTRAQAQAAKPVKLVETAKKVVEVVEDDEPALPVPTPKEAYENPKPHPFNFTVGKDSLGRTIVASSSPRGHMLIAGVTRSGKSNTMRRMVSESATNSRPDTLKFAMIDMKRADLRLFKDLPHLVAPVAINHEDAVMLLRFVRAENDRRMDILEADGLTNLDEYRDTGKPLPFPYLHLVIDEVVELFSSTSGDAKMEREAKRLLRSIASLGGSAGILVTVATQMPIAKLFPTEFRGNFGCTIAHRVNRKGESMAVLGETGADKISGVGNCLYRHNGYTTMLQTPLLTPAQSLAITAESVRRYGKPNFSVYEQFVADMAAAEAGDDDVPLFDKTAMEAA